MAAAIESERRYEDEVIGETNLARMFEDAAGRHEHRPAQHYKGGVYDRSLVGPVLEAAPDGEFRSITYGDMRTIVRNLSAGFVDIGVDPDDRVAIASSTRMEWAQADFALLATGATITTVYPDSTTDTVRYLLDHAGATGVVAENAEILERVATVWDDVETLEWVVVMDDPGDHPAADRDDVIPLADVHERGDASFDPSAYHERIDAVELDDLASIIYTSGTTGRPKGVRLTHGNFRANVNQIRKRFGPRPDKPAGAKSITTDSRAVSYLPLAHVFERLAGHFLLFASGTSIAYAESPETLQEDFALVEPTMATSVPRVYERIYAAIRDEAESSALGARVFPWATAVGREYHRTDDPGLGLRLRRAVADRLVFKKVRDALGGQIEMLISGGGSLSADLCALYHGMGLPILEGYGLTETSPVLTANPPEAPEIGTIGPLVVDVEARLNDQVELPDDVAPEADVGELQVRGPNVTDGYLDNPDANAESFTEDGWFRTGDLVERRDDGYFVFLERLKEVIVLSTGKNLAPGPIEDRFAASALVEQAMLCGDSKPFVGALVVPSVEGFQRWAKRNGEALPGDRAALAGHARVRQAIAEEIEAVNEDLESHERIRDFRLVPEEFTEANDLLTPTMKKKRRNIIDRYREELREMYADTDVEI
ncbi:MAG: AMP-dependent synthetase/ligase [Halobacteriales archaeon]